MNDELARHDGKMMVGGLQVLDKLGRRSEDTNFDDFIETDRLSQREMQDENNFWTKDFVDKFFLNAVKILAAHLKIVNDVCTIQFGSDSLKDFLRSHRRLLGFHVERTQGLKTTQIFHRQERHSHGALVCIK